MSERAVPQTDYSRLDLPTLKALQTYHREEGKRIGDAMFKKLMQARRGQ